MTRFVRRTDADFATFFMRYYLFPYDTWASLAHHQFGFVMRFESLAEDFGHVLNLLRLDQQRPLPIANPTVERQREYVSHYEVRIRNRARRVLGPYMERWGYGFPASWDIGAPTGIDRLGYRIWSFFVSAYWRYLRSP